MNSIFFTSFCTGFFYPLRILSKGTFSSPSPNSTFTLICRLAFCGKAVLPSPHGSILQRVTHLASTVHGNGGTAIFALKWVCRTDTNVDLPYCSYRQIVSNISNFVANTSTRQTENYRYSLIIITITEAKIIVEIKIVFIPQTLDRTPPIPAPIAKIIIIP